MSTSFSKQTRTPDGRADPTNEYECTCIQSFLNMTSIDLPSGVCSPQGSCTSVGIRSQQPHNPLWKPFSGRQTFDFRKRENVAAMMDRQHVLSRVSAYYFHANVRAPSHHTFQCPHTFESMLLHRSNSNRRYSDHF